ncbi:class I SAM-dependent methyltransferase [Paludibaculum fermentans]|uniref:class I SAM-dependent methyltransferase n=1 Tax=Paludibaculum fermentans TaxID=1473598 RepID=UPI003EBA694B
MTSESIWSGDYKIPWDDPAFSRRMLAEHLTQDHDMASRRLEWIDRQVEWIHRQLLAGRCANILDLGCGPGFYSHRLAALGHQCRGIDFGPASIDYARRASRDQSRCEFVLGDIRRIAFGGPYDLAMILFGEMNVFPPSEISEILLRVRASLVPDHGVLILEIQTPEAVERTGHTPPSDEHLTSGLFSDGAYRCQTRCEWVPEQHVAVQRFTVSDDAGATTVYRNTTKAWSVEDLTALLQAAGFDRVLPRADWPSNTDSLALWSAEAAMAR